MLRTQSPPYAIQIELSEGCNLYCEFCGLRGIREEKVKNYKSMSPDTMASLAEQIGKARWNARLELAMHGEPTMHPQFIEMVSILRKHLPRNQIMMTSNGGGLLMHGGPPVTIPGLYQAGLNILALDDYQSAKIVPKIREKLPAVLERMVELGLKLPVYEYPGDGLGNPHRRVDVRERMLTIMRDISIATKGTHSSLNNHCGAAAPLNDRAAGKRCAKPFREMSVRWDGRVALCCNDWRGVYKCGNIMTDGLIAIWSNAAMDAARRHLIKGERVFSPCKGCDAISYRVGLLPDPLGKEKMPEMDNAARAAMTSALSGAPYSAPVKREWENA